MTPPTSAAPLAVAPGGPITFSGTPDDDDTPESVEIYLRNSTTREIAGRGRHLGRRHRSRPITGSRRRTSAPPVQLVLDHGPLNLAGTYDFWVRATDNLGLTTANSNQGRLTVTAQVPGDAFPNGLLN